MRLTAIKMAGFKSFVDPTTFRAPTNLTGIVGPNGCGKSNIIDAVRWVMGEGSAKVLRGESMADVIFSGSSTRKPVGTATVELIFDNSDGRVGGQFASYNEISVKRQVSRDGVSLYFLNNARCRRKDVRELFLGTGLGSRSYSIIEQGMISEVVEARPEEIRGHLEEAAGISKYKERRRETERRIAHTRDNLSRLSDLREEVGKHLARLKRQANAATRYRRLKQQKRELESRLMTLRWKELLARVEVGQRDLSRRETALQEGIARQRSAEAELERLHDEQAQAAEAFNEVQGELYAVGSEIARLEQTIKHARVLQERQRAEYEETEAALQDLEKHMVLDRAQVEDLSAALAEVEPALAEAEKAEQAAAENMAGAEERVADWQQRFEQHHQRSADSQREADRASSRIETLDQRLLEAGRRIEALGQEARAIDTEEPKREAAALEKEAAQLAGREDREQQELDALREKLAQAQSELQQNRDQQQEIERALHTRQGRLESLRALQRASLDDRSAADWLERHGFSNAPRLTATVEVDEGWDTAVETVLGHWLQSVLIESVGNLPDALEGLENTSLDLLDRRRGEVAPRAGSLGEKVKAPDAVLRWLNRIEVVDSLSDAWAARPKLADGCSVITRAGEWLGPDWIRVGGGLTEHDSMLAREQAINRLDADRRELGGRAGQLAAAVSKGRTAVEALEERVRERQERLNALNRKRNEVDGQLESRQSSVRIMSERARAIGDEVAELKRQIAADESAVREARKLLERHLAEMATLEEERKQLEAQRARLLKDRDAARSELGATRDRRHELALKAESRRASLDSLRQSLERMDTQFSQLQQRFLSLSEQIAKADEPEKVHQGDMDELLQRRVATETRLSEARGRVQELEEEYRARDAQRQEAIQRTDEIRQDLERARLQQQEVQLDARSLQRQVEERGGDVHELVKDLPDEVQPEDWEVERERLQQQITRLEPVNLAAIQEYEEEQKRKQYLDAQNEDLCDALATLENAIAKIDRRTRTRFKETFERVNKGVQELFPRLFGGGHAYLELSGEDLLTTGVTIMAQPPGKRISSLHLLSGGEKALTAVAFVFSLFRLNPAPFCLLDEVDAPLDDANVVRFSSMVGEMAENIQFIIVTHNKITMEMVNQMSGVTMREPGVSRLVQVDIEEAARMAAN